MHCVKQFSLNSISEVPWQQMVSVGSMLHLYYQKVVFSSGQGFVILSFLTMTPVIKLSLCCLQTDKGFDRHTFEKQMAVMRGQVSRLFFVLANLSIKLQTSIMKRGKLITGWCASRCNQYKSMWTSLKKIFVKPRHT